MEEFSAWQGASFRDSVRFVRERAVGGHTGRAGAGIGPSGQGTVIQSRNPRIP